MSTRTRQFNTDVRQWNSGTKRKLKLEVVRMTTRYSGYSRRNLSTRTRAYQGEITRIQFGFPYYMIFVHKGAGRGYGGFKTGMFTTASGGKRKTNPASMGRMGLGKRRPKPWFNPVIEQRFPELGGIIADYHGDKVVAQIQKIMIK